VPPAPASVRQEPGSDAVTVPGAFPPSFRGFASGGRPSGSASSPYAPVSVTGLGGAVRFGGISRPQRARRQQARPEQVTVTVRVAASARRQAAAGRVRQNAPGQLTGAADHELCGGRRPAPWQPGWSGRLAPQPRNTLALAMTPVHRRADRLQFALLITPGVTMSIAHTRHDTSCCAEQLGALVDVSADPLRARCFLGIVGIVRRSFFLFTREILRFVQFFVLGRGYRGDLLRPRHRAITRDGNRARLWASH